MSSLLCKSCGLEIGRPKLRGRLMYCMACAAYKEIVRGAVTRAVLSGSLPRAKTEKCRRCDNQAHAWDHRDYSKPLDVIPLCRACNNRAEPAKMPENIELISRLYRKMESTKKKDLYWAEVDFKLRRKRRAN